MRTVAAALLALIASGAVAAQDGAGAASHVIDAAEYARLTEQSTTLPLTADDIRAIGRRELERAHEGLRGVMAEVGFEGSVAEFLAFLREDERFYFPDTDEGREAYLAEARVLAAEMREALDALIEPPASLTALDAALLPASYPRWTTAAYAAPGQRLDASSPPLETGAMLFNLEDMRSAPRFLLPVLAYHEGVPGHHLQMTVARASEGAGSSYVPAYAEGWAAYAMQLPFAMGVPDDPYAHAGRWSLRTWGPARMLVDVGVNLEGWTEEEAVAFLLANTALSERQARFEVGRCLERPAATHVYIVGMVTFRDLRARAEAALGDGFDVRAFHQEVLRYGQLTLPELEAVVDAWIAAGRGAAN